MNEKRELFLDRLQEALDEGLAGDLPQELYREAAFDSDLKALMDELAAVEAASADAPAPRAPQGLDEAIMEAVRAAPRPISAASHRGARIIVFSAMAAAAAVLLAVVVGGAWSLLPGRSQPTQEQMLAEAIESLPRIDWGRPAEFDRAAQQVDAAKGEAGRTAQHLLGQAATGLRVFAAPVRALPADADPDGALLLPGAFGDGRNPVTLAGSAGYPLEINLVEAIRPA